MENGRAKNPSVLVIFRLADVLAIPLKKFEEIFTKGEERLVEEEIAAIHQQFPNLNLMEIADLPNLIAKEQYLALLKTLSMYRERKGD